MGDKRGDNDVKHLPKLRHIQTQVHKSSDNVNSTPGVIQRLAICTKTHLTVILRAESVQIPELLSTVGLL